MHSVTIRNASRRRDLAHTAGMADRWWARLRGLLGRPPLAGGSGLVIAPCRAVHTYGMSYAIDVVFVDRAWRTVAVYSNLAPRRRTGWHRSAACAVELPAGTIWETGTTVGD